MSGMSTFLLITIWLCLLSHSVVNSIKNGTIYTSISPHFLDIGVGNADSFQISYYIENKTLDWINVSLIESRANVVQLSALNFTLKETKYSVNAVATEAGRVMITANFTYQEIFNITTRDAYVSISVYFSSALSVFSTVIGWIYFFFWTFSFYPQIWDNYKRKSVVGLNFDYLILNFVGHSCYNIFNIGLFWIPLIKKQYFEKYPRGHVIPVQPNDIAFSMHAVFATSVTLFQVLIYDRGSQRVSRTCLGILAIIFIFLGISLILSFVDVINWLEYFNFISYVKLAITLIKCCPQAYFNFRRKSTIGWSIGNVLMDFAGGVLSIFQMFIISYNYDDWSQMSGNATKFGLGALSILFDVLFIVQHYVLYRDTKENINLINGDSETPSYVNERT